MDAEDIARLINRICWGKRYAQAQDERGLWHDVIIRSLTMRERNHAEFMYNSTLKRAMREGTKCKLEILEGLKESKSLITLNLGGNRIGDEGARWIGEGLKASRSLAALDLGSNNLGPEGAR